MGRAATIAAAVAAAVFVAGFLWRGVPYLTQERQIVTSSPSVPGLFAALDQPLRPRQTLCWDNVPIDPEAARAQIVPVTQGRRGPPLRMTFRGPGYRASSDIAPSYADGTVLSVPFQGPDRSLLGTVCLRNEGRRTVALRGTNEPRALSPPGATIDGKPLENTDIVLILTEDGTASYLSRMPEILAHVEAFRPAIVGPWLLWPLALLVLVGVPAGAIGALSLSLKDEREDDADRAA